MKNTVTPIRNTVTVGRDRPCAKNTGIRARTGIKTEEREERNSQDQVTGLKADLDLSARINRLGGLIRLEQQLHCKVETPSPILLNCHCTSLPPGPDRSLHRSCNTTLTSNPATSSGKTRIKSERYPESNNNPILLYTIFTISVTGNNT